MNPLNISSIEKKLKALNEFSLDEKVETFEKVARDIDVLSPSLHPPKKGLSSLEGQQRLLHDLASIELQAAELSLRTLLEYKTKAPRGFLVELLEITKEEATHCELCLKGLKKLNGYWGMFPCHLELWNVADETDLLIERILKVHRYLEGSGLDASHSLLNRFKGVSKLEVESKIVRAIVERIADDEIRHVEFGSRWFKNLCREEGKIPYRECKRILNKFKDKLPKRRERIYEDVRRKAGFSDEEIEVFRDFQQSNCSIF